MHELHKQGYQDLAVHFYMAPSGMSWRCSLLSFDQLLWDGVGWTELSEGGVESACHSSGSLGNEYFGWEDATSDTARALAEKIKNRFPRLMEKTRRLNFEYAGWFAYMLGMAEQGHLPYMAAEYQASRRDRLATLTPGVSIKGPPLSGAWEYRGRRFYFVRPPHLRPGDDWHTAYQELIRGWQASDFICALPLYPFETNDTFELGAYWEGAVYYIQTVLGFTDIREFLSALESEKPESEKWHIFFRVWDSHGQLIYLTAFLMRRLLRECAKYDLQPEEREHWASCLRAFEGRTHSKWIEQGCPPNPYYGGENPLHLGLTLAEVSEERLFTS